MRDGIAAMGERRYLYHSSQWLLQEDVGRPEGPNIGVDGRHLTIAFSLGSAEAAGALCRSVVEACPDFGGEFLVLHGPEDRLQADGLAELLRQTRLRYRLAEAGAMHEGARRNLAARLAATPWLMWMAADLRCVWDVFPRVQRDLAELGCHFMGLRAEHERPPVVSVFAPDEHRLGVGLADGDPPDSGSSVATAFAGESLVFKIETFEGAGGYDEALPGWEDLDLSIRLLRQGLKVGSSHLSGLERRHHGRPEGVLAPDVETEVARAFEAKHGFSPSAALAPRLEPTRRALLTSASQRPKIALIVDVDNWAFSNIARQLERALGDRFDFTTIPVAVVSDIPQLFAMCEGFDLIHFFWREVPRALHGDLRAELEARGIGYEYFIDRFSRRKRLSTAVYDHLFLEPDEVRLRQPLFSEWCGAGYYVCSQKLYDIYARLPGYRAPDAVLPDGVDLSVFKPERLERFGETAARPLAVGWVGNSGWSAHLGDPKGVHTILKPALAALAGEGVPVEARFADRQHRMIPHQEMPRYYAEVDVLVCASDIEGTPNPVLEAMACGVPVVTTDVGVVRQALGPLQQDFILAERSVAAMQAALRRLHEDRALLSALSAENTASIQAWDWPKMAERFAGFFDRALSSRR